MDGAVQLNGIVVDGYVLTDESGVRLRISSDEVERLGLVSGQQVRLDAPGRGPGPFLLSGTGQIPPVV
jgi:hypothetical protein